MELSNVFIGPKGLVVESCNNGSGITNLTFGTSIIGVVPVKDIPVSKLHFIHQHLDIEFDLDGFFFVGHNNVFFI